MAPVKKRSPRKAASKSRKPKAKARSKAKPKPRVRAKARPKARPKAKPKAKPKVKGAAPRKKVEGEEIGKIVGFFRIPSAAIIKIQKGSLKVGDTIWISGHTTDLKQTVGSLQIDRQPIQEAGKGKEVGVQVSSKVRRNDRVFKI